jgi:hypothetical protein
MTWAILLANVTLRCAGIVLGAAHVIGFLRYADRYSIWAIVPGVLLLLFSVLPFRWTGFDVALTGTFAAFLAWSYFVTGFPFLNPVHDDFAQATFLIEFLVLLTYVAISGATAIGALRPKTP